MPFDEPLPRSDDAERAVLGALMIEPSYIDRVPELSRSDFANRAHEVIFQAIVELGAHADLLTVKHRLSERRLLTQAGGAAYLSSLIESTPDIANLERHAAIVTRCTERRAIITACRSAVDSAMRGAEAPERILSQLDAEILNSRFGHKGTPRNRGSKPTSIQEFLSRPTESKAWVVDRLLPAAGTSLLVAKPKVGKSTTARTVAFCVATGSPFLTYGTTRGRVLLLALEEKDSELRDQLTRMRLPADVEFLIHCGAAPRDGLAWLTRLVVEHQPHLVIVDPIFRLVRVRDSNDYSEVTNALEPLVELARTSGAHVLCVHHQSKGERADGESVLGSTALFGAVDTLLVMSRRDNVRTLRSTNRYGDDLPETTLALDRNSGLLSATGRVEELRRVASIETIRATIGTGRLTEHEIREAVGGDQNRLSAALREAVTRGEIEKTGAGKKGDPFFYSLPKTELGRVS